MAKKNSLFAGMQLKKGDDLLKINDLSVEFTSRESGASKAVNHVSLTLHKGETLGLVGETGAGKTTIALSILRLLESPPGRVTSGSIEYKGKDLYKLRKHDMEQIRGFEISMIFQDPMTALNPVDTVGEQISEVIKLHDDCSKAEAVVKAGDMM